MAKTKRKADGKTLGVAQGERLRDERFGKLFPKLLDACGETGAISRELHSMCPKLIGTEAFVKRIRSWRRTGDLEGARLDLQNIVRMHIASLMETVLTLAAGYAHEFTTLEELGCLTEECVAHIQERREVLRRARIVRDIFIRGGCNGSAVAHLAESTAAASQVTQ